MNPIDLPHPPDDIELKNIIDKLAQFVARNGREFEQMTKNKQRGNSKFEFLYGGEFYNYYQHKVEEEHAMVKQEQQAQIPPLIAQMPQIQLPQISPNLIPNTEYNTTWNTPPPSLTPQQTKEIQQINHEQDNLRQQIMQSEQNLNAQHNVLLQQEQAAVEDAIAKGQMTELHKATEECGVSLSKLLGILQPIINSCTKDSIGKGKSWFLQEADTKEKSVCFAHFLLHKVLQSSTFSEKLHVIYLVNDLLHHSARKNACVLKEQLELAVVPMFCNASMKANEEQKQKLNKLLKLWESKANYLKAETLEKLRDPIKSFQQYQSDQMAKYATKRAELAEQTKVAFERYQSQHQAFVSHAMQQIVNLQQQIQNIEHKQQIQNIEHKQEHDNMKKPPPPLPPLETIKATLQQAIQSLSQTSQPANSIQPTFPIESLVTGVNGNIDRFMPNLNLPPPNITVINPSIQVPAKLDIQPPPLIGMENAFSQPPPPFLPPPGLLPDFSKPPPGFTPKPEVDELVPTVPYYELPAGLMVPLVKLEDFEYKPLDPKDIRLPPPAPPNERLLAAVDAYYSLPTHERPRDSEGWEKLGLYEYYKAKNQARREKEDAIREGLRIKSRTPSPVILRSDKDATPPKRRYRSRTPTPPPMLYSKNGGKRRGLRSRSRSRSRSKSRSRDKSRSRSPRMRRSGKNSRDGRDGRRRRHSNSRSKSRSPPRRSLSPEMQGFGISFSRNDAELDASNKGHEILKKMGWGGRGLGAKEQGIDSPISGGDVRDRQDQYKGVGCNLNDPYENFRKNKGVAFISRMKARDKEKETVAVSDL